MTEKEAEEILRGRRRRLRSMYVEYSGECDDMGIHGEGTLRIALFLFAVLECSFLNIFQKVSI